MARFNLSPEEFAERAAEAAGLELAAVGAGDAAHTPQHRHRGVVRVVELVVEGVEDGHRGVEADEVEQRERAHREVAAALHGGVVAAWNHLPVGASGGGSSRFAEKCGVQILPEHQVSDVAPLGAADGSDGYRVTTGLGVYNLLDEKYSEGSFVQSPARNWLLTTSLKF